MRYKITKQYGRGMESSLANFNEMNEAEFFIQAKLEADALLKVNVIYRLYQFDDLIKEYDPAKSDTASQGTSGSQGQSSTAGFRPTPFNTAPKPAGTPQKWLKDDDEDMKK